MRFDLHGRDGTKQIQIEPSPDRTPRWAARVVSVSDVKVFSANGKDLNPWRFSCLLMPNSDPPVPETYRHFCALQARVLSPREAGHVSISSYLALVQAYVLWYSFASIHIVVQPA